MDLYSFLNSALKLEGYFVACAYEGILGNEHIHTLLPRIKPLGMEAESQMFQVTGGINTHKGAIFALGLLSAAAGACMTRGNCEGHTLVDATCAMVTDMVRPHFQHEIECLAQAETYGGRQYRAYGFMGARGEALCGYETSRTIGLSALTRGLADMPLTLDQGMLYALLNIITVVEDSNVIGRRGVEVLKISQGKAQEILDQGHFLTEQGNALYNTYLEWSINEGVSHGDAADLLSVSLFLWFLGNDFEKV